MIINSRVSDQNGVSPLYIMLEIHHSGREPSNYEMIIGQVRGLTDKQTGGQTDRETYRQRLKQTYRQTERHIDSQTSRPADKQTDRRQTGRQRLKQTYRQTERHIDTDKQTGGQTNRQGDRLTDKD